LDFSGTVRTFCAGFLKRREGQNLDFNRIHTARCVLFRAEARPAGIAEADAAADERAELKEGPAACRQTCSSSIDILTGFKTTLLRLSHRRPCRLRSSFLD
jgi:hypothetical protein